MVGFSSGTEKLVEFWGLRLRTRWTMGSSDESRAGGGKSDVGRLLDLINGYQATCVIVAALETGVLEQMARGPVTVDALAALLGAHRPSLERLLVAMGVVGLVEREGDALALTARGKMLQKGDFGLRDWATLVGAEYLPAWANLAHTVMTGGTGFEHAFGKDAWEHRRQNPRLDEAFNRITSGAQVRTTAALLDAYDFSARGSIVDIGGGQGKLLSAVLRRYPSLRGTLFDQPHVVRGAESVLAAAGVHDRCRIVGGSFLDTVPEGSDCYVLKHVLHNWDDQHCVRILERCRAAMHDGASLLILENVITEKSADSAAFIVMLDIHMMAVHGGRERTLEQYAALLSAAGLRLVRHIATRETAADILEATVAANAVASSTPS
jgi:hypothetical protein